MSDRRRTIFCVLVSLMFMVTGVAGPAAAAGGGGGGGDDGGPGSWPPAKPIDPEYTAAVRAIDKGDFGAAIPMLEHVVDRDASNADAYNWLAYAVRKTGDARRAIPIYEKALAIDPKHRGAHEYIGEAYLALDDVGKAREHLARLNSLCFFPCSQYRDLKKAIEAYEKNGGKVKPTAAR